MALTFERLRSIIIDAGYDPTHEDGPGNTAVLAVYDRDDTSKILAHLIDACSDVGEAADVVRTCEISRPGYGRTIICWPKVEWPEPVEG